MICGQSWCLGLSAERVKISVMREAGLTNHTYTHTIFGTSEEETNNCEFTVLLGNEKIGRLKYKHCNK